MKSQKKALRFFLGVNTPQGFVSRFDRISDKTGGWRTFIIKGGPGSGKSTLMKKIAEELKGEDLELIHCSSDFNSLDAVICPARKFAIADGTAPHVDVNKQLETAHITRIGKDIFFKVDLLYSQSKKLIRPLETADG